ncbi:MULTISPECIES: YdeI/OmpD-associated family protein [Bacillus]|uniref:YdeI/OmpD-associated family protein n=1 Tax=Bacillus TaxID=1386 RepID=UPI00030C5368|nr:MULTISPECIES: YdeI/OmpD-associated family protein [Bacillus]
MNSKKSVIEKLNLTKYPTKAILNVPDDIGDFAELSYDSQLKKNQYDLIFIFIFSLEEFLNYLQEIIEKQLVSDKGYLFFAYPKKNNKKYDQYIDRDVFFEEIPVDDEGYVKDSQIKFARMVSLNNVFTIVGLKSEPKKVKKKTSEKKSQCVDDYIIHVDDIKAYLCKKEDLLKIYNELTFGYQKDWARYVYSAKRKETQTKRLLEMETILAEGYKSIALYRRK